ncbi:MAG: SRPBCC family protein [Caulobacterales bacterium]
MKAVALAALLIAPAASADASGWSPTPKQEAQLARAGLVVDVAPDPGRSTALIHGAVNIPAPPLKIWETLRACAKVPRMATFVTGCQVMSADPAGAWDVRQDAIDYGFPLPHVRRWYRSEYDVGRRISFRCVDGGEVKACQGEWRLELQPGGAVRVTYESWIVSPFKAPAFLVRNVLRKDTIDALKALRREALAAQ